MRLKAARLAHRDAMARAWASAVSGTAPSEEEQIAVTSASVFAAETCAEVVSDLFRYGGKLRDGGPLPPRLAEEPRGDGGGGIIRSGWLF